jgi:hypothetical protein
MPTLKADGTQSVWHRVLDESWADLSPAEAAKILTLRFGKGDLARMRLLGERARDGTLSPAERAELQEFTFVGRMLTLFKSLARQRIASAPVSPAPRSVPARGRRRKP